MSEEITKPIILLSGPIGAGKTTVAQELIKSATTPTVYIEGDKFWLFIVKGDKTIGRKKDFGTIMWSMMAASVPYACGGYKVILDFSIPPWFLDSALKITRTRNVPLEYIVIKPSENICAQRAAHRKEGVIADYSVYHDFYLDFAVAEKYSISDDLSDAKSIANTINENRKKGKFNIVRS